MSSLNISNDLDSAEADTNWFHVIAISTAVFALLVIGGAIFLHYHEERPILTHFVVPATATATAASLPPALMATGDPDVSASMSKEDDDTEYKSNDNSRHTVRKESSDYEYEDTGEVAGFEQDVVDAANKTTTVLAVNANAKDFSEFDSGSDSAELIRASDSMAILQKLEQQQKELMRCYAAKNGSVADLPEASFHTHQQQQLNSTPHSAASSRTPLLSEFCLQCLCETATECRSVDCGISGGVACGIFRISYNYWIDAGRPRLQGVDDKENMNEREVFMQCVSNAFCAARALQANMQKYARDCNMDGKIDCWDYAELHILGPTGCVRDEMPPVFAMRLNRCLAKYK